MSTKEFTGPPVIFSSGPLLRRTTTLFHPCASTSFSRGEERDLGSAHRCVSLIGYCMLPMVVLSALSLFLPRGGAVIVVLAVVFVTWSARVCNKLQGKVARWDEHPGLVAYACFLVYSLFSLLLVF